jgi:ADP-heptose:LPS heptosyltransferase
MHLAFALKKEVICLFGPCSPDQYGKSSNAHIIYKNTYCSPCVHDFEIAPCNGNNICMQLIGVEEVNEKIASLLNATKIEDSASIKPIIYQTDQDILGIVQR